MSEKRELVIDMQLVNFNGEIIPADSNIISIHNRSFRYGDGLFESMRCNKNGINFMESHVRRLLLGLEAMKMSIPDNFTPKYVSDQVSRLYGEHKMTEDARVRFTVYRNEGGLYVPSTNEFSYLIEITELDESGYLLNESGLHIGIYKKMKKPVNDLSNFKTANALLFVMAGIYKDENNWDECLIVNERDEIIEAISCNMFMVSDEVLITPALSSGCVAGVMREAMIRIAGQHDIVVVERNVSLSDIKSADELFLTNASVGIKWVGQLGITKYDNNLAAMLSGSLENNIELVR